MAPKTRWGILATGGIARLFAEGLQAADGAELVAVGSRTQEAADEFGDKYNVPHRYGTYEQLANDPDVDVIYVSTPHTFHKDNTLMCLNAGKAVLCEKPFAINAGEAAEMIALARAKKLFLMEAMWTRYFPVAYKVRELLAQGAIGEVRMVTLDFGFRFGFDPKHRLLNPDLGGGALLDVGVYCMAMASMVLGKPTRVTGFADLGTTGVDEQAAVVMGYEGGRLASFVTAVRTQTAHEALIMGTKGRIKIHHQFWRPEKITLTIDGEGDTVIEMPKQGNGYNYQAEEVARCLSEGELESDIMPLDETLAIAETMDAIRAQWGLKYPMEA